MTISENLLEALQQLDTPTVCNALDVVAPERRMIGFNRKPLICPVATKGPVVGYAATAQIQSREPGALSADEKRALRLHYYEMIEKAPKPSLTVLQDIDGPDCGIGAFWGEVQSNIHRGLGCSGVITDGSIRDIDDWANGFFALAGSVMPSHVWADLVAIDVPVSIAGMVVTPGDLIHADKYGAVVIPEEVAGEIPAAADRIVRREAIILKAARSPGFSTDDLRKAFQEGDQIH